MSTFWFFLLHNYSSCATINPVAMTGMPSVSNMQFYEHLWTFLEAPIELLCPNNNTRYLHARPRHLAYHHGSSRQMTARNMYVCMLFVSRLICLFIYTDIYKVIIVCLIKWLNYVCKRPQFICFISLLGLYYLPQYTSVSIKQLLFLWCSLSGKCQMIVRCLPDGLPDICGGTCDRQLIIVWSLEGLLISTEAGSHKNESFWRKKLIPCNEFHVIVEIKIHKIVSSYFERTLIETPTFHLRHDSALNS